MTLGRWYDRVHRIIKGMLIQSAFPYSSRGTVIARRTLVLGRCRFAAANPAGKRLNQRFLNFLQILTQEGKDALLALVCLGKHGNARLLDNVVVRKVHHFCGHVRIADAGFGGGGVFRLIQILTEK